MQRSHGGPDTRRPRAASRQCVAQPPCSKARGNSRAKKPVSGTVWGHLPPLASTAHAGTVTNLGSVELSLLHGVFQPLCSNAVFWFLGTLEQEEDRPRENLIGTCHVSVAPVLSSAIVVLAQIDQHSAKCHTVLVNLLGPSFCRAVQGFLLTCKAGSSSVRHSRVSSTLEVPTTKDEMVCQELVLRLEPRRTETLRL